MEEIMTAAPAGPKVETNTQSKSNKCSRKKFLMFFIAVCSLVVVLLLLFTLFKTRFVIEKKPLPEAVSENGESVFSNLLNNTDSETNNYEVDLNKLDEDFKEEISPLISNAGTMFVDWDSPWRWETSWIFGGIVSATDKEIVINVTKPEGMGTITASYTCEPSKAILMARENLVILATGITFLNTAKPGYLIYTHCLNEKCDQVGNGCILVKMF
jgi:hypothetical protein